ncbi:MAG: response regulator [Thermodesulfovibrionales bacterium]|nr:response regulator [Thermodesulfovibrionales bacterium]
MKGRSDYPLIMIIEDDRVTSELISLYLSHEGYKVTHVFNGSDAINKIKELKPFAIILDIMMPNKDGWDILQEIKSDPDIKDIPVIIYSIVDNKELGFALGATDFLVKPVDRKILIDRINELNFKSRGDKKTTVLCIDDNEEILDYLKEVLESAGYNVITTTSGKKGIESAVAHIPDLIILDIMMPDMNGFEVAHILKSKPETNLIPIIIFTAKELTINDRLKLAGKVKKIMQKSHFNRDDLLKHIRDFELIYPQRAGLLDEVSGLFDNSYFQLRLAQEINRGIRYKTTFSLLIIDIDAFTEYVKISGIHRANMLIKKYADFLKRSIRGSDIVVRYGIDEFAIILANTPKEQAIAVAQRFISYIESYPFYKSDLMPKGNLTASVSLVNFPKDSTKIDDLLHKSNELLKKAKSLGGNKVEVYGQAI